MKKLSLCMALGLATTLLVSACSLKPGSKDNDSTPTTDTTEIDTNTENEDKGFIAIQPVITSHTFSEMKDDGTSYLISASLDTIALDEESAQYYSALNDGLNAYSDTRLSAFLERYNSNLENAKTDYEDGMLGDMYYEDNSSIRIQRVDESVFSFTENVSSFTGGAHGNYGTTGTTFDTQTGKELDISDVVVSTEDLIPILKERLETDYPDTAFFDLDETLQAYIDEPETYQFCWYMTSEGITFVFNPYELASYADGSQTVSLSFCDYPDLFKDTYGAQTGAFVTELSFWADGSDTNIDLDRDGSLETIHLSAKTDEYMYSSATFTYNEHSYTLDEYFNDMDAKLVHTKDGKNYIYAFLHEDNDYTFLKVMEITDDAVTFSGEMQGAEPNEYLGSDEGDNPTWNAYPFVSPNGFILSTRLDSLSTYDGVKTYAVGENGVPVATSDFYRIMSGITLTVKKDFEAKDVDYSTYELGNPITVSAGEKLTFIRTNGTDTVIFEKEDGTYVGVKYEVDEDFNRLINGESADNLFDGMIYAG